MRLRTGDGTYNIAYDDGESEQAVAEALIRALEPEPEPEKEAVAGKFATGDAVEARYRGKKKYYPGKISKDNGERPCRNQLSFLL